MKVLITGITGMIGSHLADCVLEQSNTEVYGFKRWRSDARNIQHIVGQIEMFEGDIEDPLSVEKALRQIQPDLIFHLAAQAYALVSWDAPTVTFSHNVLGTINMLEGMRKANLNDTRIIIACSSAEYGLVKEEDVPIKEEHPLRPINPYGVSKVAQELLGFQYYKSYGLWTVMPRIFNQIGPRHTDVISVQNFCKQVAGIENELRPPVVHVGNLTARRDFLDVRDGVRALWALAQKGAPGEAYNLCSGKAPTIKECLDMILSLSKKGISVEKDPARLRPVDEPILLGDNSKLQQATGWSPRIRLEQTMEDMLDYWRQVVKNNIAHVSRSTE